ncbi:MAG: transcription antitermination factor NusB [Chloroflexales bacterium]
MVSLRHQVRIAALQILFEVDATDHPLDVVYERCIAEEELTEEGERFLSQIIFGCWEHRSHIDGIIEDAAPNWPVTQMPGIDKAILRIALFELLFDDVQRTPVKAVINEAVELAKHFGSDNSSRFVNGVLGTVVSRYRPGNEGPLAGNGDA